ncbi:MAG: hypothetical protein ABI824_15740 [Acidobacteriota bacterium]
MQKANIAEWILSLAMPPDRAHSSVGDLMEEGESRSRPWFWFSVVQATSTQVFREITGSPWDMLKLYLWGWWAGIALIGTVLLPTTWLLDPIAWKLGFACGDSQCWPVVDWGNPWLKRPLEIATVFIAGWLMANRSKGRELSAAFASILFGNSTHLVVMYLSALQVRRIGQPWPIEGPVLSLVVGPMVAIAAALYARYRRLSTTTPPVAHA